MTFSSLRSALLWLGIGAALAVVSSPARGDQSVTLAWDSNPEPDIAGYVLRFGQSTGHYTSSTNVGNVTTTSVHGLTEGQTYYFAVAAYNDQGLEGELSPEVHFDTALSSRRTPLPPSAQALACLLRFEEKGGGSALDSSGHDHHGELIGSPSWTHTGATNHALNFDGQNVYVRLAAQGLVDFSRAQFTIALWVNTSRRSPQLLVEKAYHQTQGLLLLAMNRNDHLIGGFSVFDGKGLWLDSKTRQVADGRWHHLAVTSDEAGLKLYYDGKLDSAFALRPNYASTGDEVNLGRFVSGGGIWAFEGQADEVRFYSRPLSATEIADLLGEPLGIRGDP